MRIGNIVDWSNGLWIITKWTEHIIDKDYTIQGRMVSFTLENVSAGVTNREGTKFHIDDVTYVAETARDFVINNLSRMLFRRKL